MINFLRAVVDCMQQAMAARAEMYVKTKGWE